MTTIFNAEAILTGLIDHYCLVCEVYLQNETEISRHIKSTSHRDNLASCPYYKKSTLDDRIRKVKHGYYCEVCNVLMRTPTNVSLHLTGDKHNDKKVLLVKRVGNTIIDKYGKVIAMENWHGLTDDGTCVLCDTEYDDKNAHTLENDHLLNLVRKTVEFDSDDNIYRKLDEKTSHCIICNDVVLNDKISAHNEQDKHLSNSRRREIYEISEVDVAVTTHSAQHQQEVLMKQNVSSAGDISALNECQSSVSESTDRKEAIVNSLEQFQKYSMNINFETETAFCKKCNKNVDFKYESIKHHIDYHKDAKLDVESDTQKKNTSITETPNSVTESGDSQVKMDEASGSNVEDPKMYAAENFITHNDYNKDAYCRVCETRLSSALKCMKEHVNGAGHKKKLANKNKAESSIMQSENKGNANSITKFTEKRATTVLKQIPDLFIKSIRLIKSEDDKHIFLNEKFLIDHLSYVLISRGNNYGFKCHSCEVTLASMLDLELHLKFTAHSKLMDHASVIITYENEFIRECRPGIYHCGYCNLVKDSIVGLEKHLKSSLHLAKRHSAEKLSLEIMTHIRVQEFQERVFAEVLFKSGLNRFFGRMNRFDDSDSD